ncbi:MAG: glycosyltransferase [Acaryochloridaceae cyanobacterium SU_2_1]|nr:glycosyltransferase [Acaryochloridaceae cyanobacterium SU_2_1]
MRRIFVLLDHDDLWTPDKLEVQLNALERLPHIGVAYSWTTYLYQIKEQIFTRSGLIARYEGDVYSQLLLNNFIESGSNILVRRQAIDAAGFFDAAPTNCEDWDYYLRLAAQWLFALVPRHQILYRQSANTMSSQVKKTEEGGLILLEKAYQLAPAALHCQKNQSYAQHYQHCANLYLGDNMDLRAALESLRMMQLAINKWPVILLRPGIYLLICKLTLKMIIPARLINLLSNIKFLFKKSKIEY